MNLKQNTRVSGQKLQLREKDQDDQMQESKLPVLEFNQNLQEQGQYKYKIMQMEQIVDLKKEKEKSIIETYQQLSMIKKMNLNSPKPTTGNKNLIQKKGPSVIEFVEIRNTSAQKDSREQNQKQNTKSQDYQKTKERYQSQGFLPQQRQAGLGNLKMIQPHLIQKKQESSALEIVLGLGTERQIDKKYDQFQNLIQSSRDQKNEGFRDLLEQAKSNKSSLAISQEYQSQKKNIFSCISYPAGLFDQDQRVRYNQFLESQSLQLEAIQQEIEKQLLREKEIYIENLAKVEEEVEIQGKKGGKKWKKRLVLIKRENPLLNEIGKKYCFFLSESEVGKLEKKETKFLIQHSSFRDFLGVCNFSNNLFVFTPQEKNCPVYKFNIGKGNNQILIKMIFKSRWWWVSSDTVDENTNFLWTQTKRDDYLEIMTTKQSNFYLSFQNSSNMKETLFQTQNSFNRNLNQRKLSKNAIQFQIQNGINTESLNSTFQIQQNSNSQQNSEHESDDGGSQTVSNNENSSNGQKLLFQRKKIYSQSENQILAENEKNETNTNGIIEESKQKNQNLLEKKKSYCEIGRDEKKQQLNDFLDKKKSLKTQGQEIDFDERLDSNNQDKNQILQKNKGFGKAQNNFNFGSENQPINLISQKAQEQVRKLLNKNDSILLQELASKKDEKQALHEQIFKDPETVQKMKNTNEISLIKDSTQFKFHNHLQGNFHLGSKKLLYYNMKNYYESLKKDVHQYLPLTYHIKEGALDNEFLKFVEKFKEVENNQNGSKQQKSKNIWIIKPGENSNRGFGIQIHNQLQGIQEIIDQKEFYKDGIRKTYIIQQYLEKPLLYQKRKFDIRCYTLLTKINGIYKGYWYEDGYVRTSSYEYSVKNLDKKNVHLTNDAVQKKNDQYGKYERGNKVSYQELDAYIKQNYAGRDFFQDIYPQMKLMATDSFRSIYGKLNQNSRETGMEIFGLDFMIDENFKVWLIEINTNPCLEISSNVLQKIIPPMVDNAFRIAVDPIFPPPNITNPKKLTQENFLENNKFELIFDQEEDGQYLRQLLKDQTVFWTVVDQIEEERDDQFQD